MITEKRIWNAEDMRALRIRERWYTSGDCEDYAAFLESIGSSEPTTDNILAAAKNVIDHTKSLSDDLLPDIMTAILNGAVTLFYEEGDE